MKKYNLLILIMLLVLSACDDFLSEPPSKSTSIQVSTTEHLDFLLNSYNEFYQEGNTDVIFGSDDFGLLVSLYDNNPAVYDVTVAQYATWDVENLAVLEDRPYYPAEWEKIYKANLVLDNLGDVTGPEEDKMALKAEAHFIRAYSYYQMVNTYCLPYATENMDELGLTLKKSTSFEESSARVSLQETWDFIVSDLEEALKLDRELEFIDGKYRTWRASTPAINAFAARVYLTMGDYTKALTYAQSALDDHNELVDYNTEMSYTDQIIEVKDGDGNPYRLMYPYTYEGQGATDIRMAWKEMYYFRFLNNGYWNYFPSEELLAIYDQTNDLRYVYHMVEGYSYDRGCTISHPAYIFFFDKIPSGPTTAEMLLVKAEC
ncbi:RagB/SusD family nutrient uptake outer membrane protein [Saccharicrinis sp. 156]|uniref:RagB/SusD family nutrient uptake outer membrane protein n=1 Tax=Saccharicrinis sp. 156 TaxID=3417574 RepID=UPI003D33D2F0